MVVVSERTAAFLLRQRAADIIEIIEVREEEERPPPGRD
jgi:hypothetical protein